MNAIKFATHASLKSYRGLSYSFIMVPTKQRNELKVQLTKLRSITHCHTYNTLLDYIKYVRQCVIDLSFVNCTFGRDRVG